MRTILLILTTCILFGACKNGYEPINYGKEACAHCKMTIIDKRYAAEMITKKGKIYKFDDLLCMKKFINENDLSSQVGDLYIANYKEGKNNVLNVQQAILVHNDYFKTPMNGNCAAFDQLANAKSFIDSLHAQIITWNNIN